MVSTTELRTMIPSRRFHPTDQYPAKPYPRCLMMNSTKNTALKMYSMMTFANSNSSVSG